MRKTARKTRRKDRSQDARSRNAQRRRSPRSQEGRLDQVGPRCLHRLEEVRLTTPAGATAYGDEHGALHLTLPEKLTVGEAPYRLLDMAHEKTADRIDLPHGDHLQAWFGKPLDHIDVISGPMVADALAVLGAQAASLGEVIFLATPVVSETLVAHEVIHALQNQGTSGPEALKVLEPSEPAEKEAVRLTGAISLDHAPDQEAEITERLSPDTLALRRIADTPPITPSPGPPTDEERFEQATTEAAAAQPAPAEEQIELAADAGEASAQEGPTEDLDGALTEAAENGELEPQPTFEPAALPETELSPEEAAARQAELEATEAAIEQAEDAGGLMGAFADAPPSVKAAHQAALGERMDGVVRSDQQQFEEGLPEFKATMGGEIEAGAVSVVQAPEEVPTVLEEAPPPPAPEVALPPVETPAPYRGNEGVVGSISRLFDSDPADAVGRSLSEVRTTDNVDTSPGDPPQVPLEGENDPERIENQNAAAGEQAAAQRRQANQAVIEGPGPEQAQLHQMDEAVPLPELVQPQVQEVPPVEGAERFNQMQLPTEVAAQFDQDQGARMQAGMAEARTQVEQAEANRDQQREQAVREAESEREQLETTADDDQRAAVLEARQTIQSERQNAIDAQDQAVRDLETQAESERASRQGEIQTRVREDEVQITDRYTQAETDADARVQEGEREAEAERDRAEREAREQSWWDRAVNFVKQAFAALTALINTIFDAVRSAVKGLLDAARDFAKGLIDLAASFIKGVIEAFGELLKGLVDHLLGDIFPGLAAALTQAIDDAVNLANAAVDAVANTLKAGVDALVNALQSGLDAILDAFQGALNIALGVLQAALTGDWAALATMVLEAALRLLGIDPVAFYAFIGRALDTIDLIINDPVGFLGNLVDAVVLGIQKFADNFLNHLKAGIIGWLTGALGDIQIPDRFDLIGLLDLARQILGITWDWIRQKAVRLIGEQNVQRLEFIYSYIQTLIDGGFPALFQRLMDDLSGLVDTILGAIKSFLVEKVIIAGITWLASLFNPVGALVKLLFTIWNLYQFLRDQLARIIQVVQTVVEGIGNIARGIIDGAATRIEAVLANLLPIAIDLVAKLLGLTGVAARVRRIIADVRERLDRAVDRLIERVLSAFRGGGAAAEQVADEPAADAAVDGQIGAVMTIPVQDAPDHTLFIDVEGANATVMMRSEEKPVMRWLSRFETDIAAMEDAEKKGEAQGFLDQTRTVLTQLDTRADEEATETQPATTNQTSQPDAGDAAIIQLEGQLRDALSSLFNALGVDRAGLLAQFADQTSRAHPDVLPDLDRALRSNAEDWQSLSWEEIVDRLREEVQVFSRPLLVEHTFGANAQRGIRDRLPALAAQIDATLPDDLGNFMSHTVVRQINTGSDAEYIAARQELQAIQLGEVSRTQTTATDAAVQKALEPSEVDPRLENNVKGSTVVDFLVAMAKNQAMYDIQPTDFSGLWGETPNPNRTHIKDKFLDAQPRSHEWVPRDFIGAVIARGQQAANQEGIETAAKWVEFQHAFRSPTQVLIFPARDPYRRTVPFQRNPQTKAKLNDRSVVVFQGHPGAVYAPVKASGYRDKAAGDSPEVAQQTQGSPGWHRELGLVFTANVNNAVSSSGMQAVLDGVNDFFINNVWLGTSAPSPVFREYYASQQAEADGNTIAFAELQRTAQSAKEEFENNFNSAKGVI